MHNRHRGRLDASIDNVRHVNKKLGCYKIKFAVLPIVLLLLSSLPANVFAASAGFANPTMHSTAPRAGSTINWTNTGNILASDDTYSIAQITTNANTNFLVAKGFGFSIPNNAIIKGIEVTVEKKSAVANRVFDLEVNLVKNGVTPVGQNKANGIAWPTADVITPYGGSTDLWLTGWSPSEINDPNFGVVVAARAVGAGFVATSFVDNVQVKIYYNIPPVANDNTFTIFMNQILLVANPGVVVNDDDDDGDILTAILVTGPSNGILENFNGGFKYTPNLDFVGVDTYTYQVSDGMVLSNIATVTINVLPEGDRPVEGRILPLDTVSLLLAGIQASAIWMIPTLAGLAGAGFYLMKFRNDGQSNAV